MITKRINGILCTMIIMNMKHFLSPIVDATSGGFFGSGAGQIIYSRVECQGGENSLEECFTESTISGQCNHNHDVGVVCQGTYIILLALHCSSH